MRARNPEAKRPKTGDGAPRPRKSKDTARRREETLDDILAPLLARKILVTQDGRRRPIPAIEAIALGLAEKSLADDPRAVRLMLKFRAYQKAAGGSPPRVILFATPEHGEPGREDAVDGRANDDGDASD